MELMAHDMFKEISVVVSRMLEFFSLAELYFVLEKDAQLSLLDVNRVNKIGDGLRYLHGSKQPDSQVALVIELLSSAYAHRTLARPESSLDSICYRQSLHVLIVPYSTMCPICGVVLNSLDAQQRTVKVYGRDGSVKGGRMFYVPACNFYVLTGTIIRLVCDHDSSPEHGHLPRAIVYGNFFKCNGQHVYSHKSLHAGDFVYVGGDFAVERAVIDRFSAEFIHHDLSIHAMVHSLNQEAANNGHFQLTTVDPHVLSFILYCYLYIQLDICVGNQEVRTPARIDDHDQWTWAQFPRLLTAFTHLWMNHETLIGRCNEQCSKCLVVDGNQKCRRRICAFKDVRVNTNEMQDLVIGCCRTPATASRFCDKHQDFMKKVDGEVATSRRVGENSPRAPRSRMELKSRNDANKLNATNCRTMKERSPGYVNKCTRSFGFIALVHNCRVICCFSELFRSETLREIINLFVGSIDGE
jgi:hypothetical protein